MPGTHPAAPLRDPLGNAAIHHESDHKAGHPAQEAGQAAPVDVQGQAVAKAQESHHPAPVDAALKQAAGRAWRRSVGAPREACFPAPTLVPPPLSQLESKMA